LSQLGRELETRTDPPIRACWIYNCNPVATVPDQARVVRELSRPDRFVVVHEQSWTDTCEVADLVLPATTFLEHHELSRSYSGYVVQWSTPAIAPVGESRSNHRVLQDLGTRLGVPDEVSEEDLAREILAGVGNAPSFEELQARHAVELAAPVQFVDTFPTWGGVGGPGGKVRLSPPPRHREAPGAEWPLVLISPATSKAISSTLYESESAAVLEMHPADATARSLLDGSIARAFNDQGEVVAPVRIAAEVREGVVVLPKGLWRRATKNGWTSNALIPDHVDEHGGGACYNDARVEVEVHSR
jgi:anaerobic selenocysteine-containing dehydrogenase